MLGYEPWCLGINIVLKTFYITGVLPRTKRTELEHRMESHLIMGSPTFQGMRAT